MGADWRRFRLMSLIPLGILAASGAGGATSFESIATATGTGSSGTITFSSIPSTYQHLQIRYNVLNSAGSGFLRFQINSDTGTNYARHRIDADGSAVAAAGIGSDTYGWASLSTLNTTSPYVGILDFLDYKSTTKNKTVRGFWGTDANGSGLLGLSSTLWLNTNAITSISIFYTANNFTTSSTIALYGIKGA